MKKIILIMSVALALVFASCDNGSSSSHKDSSGHTHSWALQADGSWKCTTGGETLSGTTVAYIAQLDKAPASGGQPSGVTAINATSYTYTNTSGTAKMVIIRTTGGDLTINAPLDTVYHYGTSGTVNVLAVASMSYDGHAEITEELVAKAGHIKLSSDIASAIPQVTVPADATGAVAIDIPEDVVVEAVTVASAQTTSLKIEGSVNTVTDTGAGTTTVEVASTGIVDKTDGVTATGAGYVADNNGAGEMGTAADDFTGSPWKIYTPKGLAEVATRVNGGETGDIQLERSILLSDAWTPIGTAGNPFSGTFDGQGHKIAGLAISNSTADYVGGLFGVVTGTSVFKNVTIDVSIEASGSGSIVGGLYGKPDASCTSVTISGITVGGSVAGTKYAAGVVAQHRDGSLTFTGVTNNAAVNGQYAAGILGGAGKGVTSLAFTTCKNTANITATKWAGAICANLNTIQVPGVSSYIHTSQFCTYSGCSNTGTVSGSQKSAMIFQENSQAWPSAGGYNPERGIKVLACNFSFAYFNSIGLDGSYMAEQKKFTFDLSSDNYYKDNNNAPAGKKVTIEWFATQAAVEASNYACYIRVDDGAYMAFDTVIGAEMACLSDAKCDTGLTNDGRNNIYLLKDCTEDVNTFLNTPYSSGKYYTAWRSTDLIVTLHKNGHAYNYPSYTVNATDVFKVVD